MLDMSREEIEVMMRAAEAQRRREAPRTKRELLNRVTMAVAMGLASSWERPAIPAGSPYEMMPPREPRLGVPAAPMETPKTRMIRLFERDPVYYHTVTAAVSLIMQGIDDYERLRED